MDKRITPEFPDPDRRVQESLFVRHPEAFKHSVNWRHDRFINQSPGVRDLRQVFQWLRTRQPQRWPSWVENKAFPLPPLAAGTDSRSWRVTYVNHSTVLWQIGSYNLITDPVYSERVSPISWAGPRRVRSPGVALRDLPRIDVVLLSHNHYDHMDLPTLCWLNARDAPLIVTGLGNGYYLRRNRLNHVVELDWWESHVWQDLRLHFVPAQHFSGRGARDRDQALWGGLVIETPHGNGYFAGDTGYGPHFRQLRERFGRFRFSLIPIGAYEPRWFMKLAHINPEEAVQVHRELHSMLSMGIHFNTFQLTDEPIDAPVQALQQALAAQGISEESFWVVQEGEGRDIPLQDA